MNVRINAAGYDDKVYCTEIITKGNILEQKAIESEKAILDIVNKKIGV